MSEALAMAETARRVGSGLGTEAARRLISRPIHRHVTVTAPSSVPFPPRPLPEQAETIDVGGLTNRLEAEIRLMKAVVAAERRENAHLRACIGFDEDDLGPEARAVRDRWAALVEKLIQTAL